VSGHSGTRATQSVWNPCDTIGFVSTVSITGTAGAGTFSFTSPGERGRFITFSGTFTATRMTLTAGPDAVMTLNRQ
jgi:hypothetical protein